MGWHSENFQCNNKAIKEIDMKLGILTFHRAHNYGAMLQAYALSQTLAAMGNEVEFVDYRQPKVEDAFRLFSLIPYRHNTLINKVKILTSRVLTLYRRIVRYNNFRRFGNKYLKQSPEYVPGVGLPSRYDVLVFGSDQIWTTRFLKDFDPVLWGETDIKCDKKIAYAPSMEMSQLTAEQQEFCRTHISNFNSISVREDKMKELLAPLTDKDIEVVIDPVFLKDKEEYEGLASNSKLQLPEHYILVYSIGSPTGQLDSIVSKVSEDLKLPVYYLSSDVGMKHNSHRLDTAGPEDFLKAFSNADFIVTTTFHGTAFAVLFEKSFYSMQKVGLSGRAESLLNKLGLNNALISDESEAAKGYPTIEYSQIKEKNIGAP